MQECCGFKSGATFLIDYYPWCKATIITSTEYVRENSHLRNKIIIIVCIFVPCQHFHLSYNITMNCIYYNTVHHLTRMSKFKKEIQYYTGDCYYSDVADNYGCKRLSLQSVLFFFFSFFLTFTFWLHSFWLIIIADREEQ